MNSDDLRLLLAERAADVDDRPVDRVGQVRARVRTARRRRVGGAVAAALVLVVGIGVSIASTVGDPRGADPVSPVDPAPTDPLDQYRDVPQTTTEQAVPLEPGRWVVTGVGRSTMPRVALDIPYGYLGSGAVIAAAGAGPTREVGYWSPTHVQRDPCRSTDDVTPETVRTAAETAEALAAQRRSRTTRPVPVSIDGYDGVSLELRTGIAPRSCADGAFQTFGTYDGGRWLLEAGVVEHYWILDVRGQVVLLSTTVGRGAPLSQVDELAAIVESAELEKED